MQKQNNGFIKNPFLYLLIIFLLVTGFQYFFAGRVAGRSQEIKYSELVQEITNDNVKEMTYQPSGSVIEVSGVYKTAKTMIIFLGNLILLKKQINSDTFELLTNAIPAHNGKYKVLNINPVSNKKLSITWSITVCAKNTS